MRTLLAGLAVFFVCWFGLAAIEAGEKGDARIRARVREYTEPTAGALRRDLIVRELSGVDAPLAARVIREAILSDARRGAAADLAARLRLAGVFDLAKRWADGPAAPQIVRLAMAAPEPEAAVWVADRWRTADPASERFRVVDDLLLSGRAAQGVVERLAPSLGDPEKSAAALAVLREQMGIDDPCPSALRDRWAGAWLRYVFEAREVPRGGEDLLALPGWRLGAARRVGRNLRIAPRASVDLAALPPPAQVDAGVLRLSVAADAGRGVFVSLRCGSAQELRLSCDGAWWFLVEGPPRDGARVEAPFRPAAWSEIEVRVTDPGIRDRPGVRDVRVLVDGAELRPSGGFWRLASPPESLGVGAGEAPTCVGGVTWERAR